MGSMAQFAGGFEAVTGHGCKPQRPPHGFEFSTTSLFPRPRNEGRPGKPQVPAHETKRYFQSDFSLAASHGRVSAR